jgi:hypothetical protein
VAVQPEPNPQKKIKKKKIESASFQNGPECCKEKFI